MHNSTHTARLPLRVAHLLAMIPLLGAGCVTTSETHEVRPVEFEAPEEEGVRSIKPATPWSVHSQGAHRTGRLTFFPQPTPEQLSAFAEAGGRVVINNRTQKEIDKQPFDERALVESLGMTYVHTPTSSATFDGSQAIALSQTLETTQGPILMHCGSGSRSASVYGMYLIMETGMDKKNAIDAALDLGMGSRSGRVIERELMDTPDRVMDAVSPEQIRMYIDTLAGFGTRHTLSETESSTRGIGAARRWVRDQFVLNTRGHAKAAEDAPRVYFDAHTVQPDGRRIPREVEVVNVICEIPGTDPVSRDRYLYVLAHLDSRASGALDSESDAPGANDDASGVALMLELARVLAAEPLECTVILMATSGEEQGLFGARMHARDCVEGDRNIVAVLNNDTVGDPTGVLEGQDGSGEIRVFSEGLSASMLSMDDSELSDAVRWTRLYGTEADAPSRQLARYIEDVADLHKTAVQPRLIYRPDRFLRGGDHTPFNEMGFPAVRFCETYENYDHQHQDVRTEDGVQFGDLPEFVDEEYLANVTRLNALTLVHLANAPSAPGDTRVIIAELTNVTTLRWAPSPQSDVAGYEIVWRETTSPQWESSLDVGNATEGTVELSKDNYFFGVRAYDHDGHRSLVSMPRPARQ